MEQSTTNRKNDAGSVKKSTLSNKDVLFYSNMFIYLIIALLVLYLKKPVEICTIYLWASMGILIIGKFIPKINNWYETPFTLKRKVKEYEPPIIEDNDEGVA